MEAEKSNLEDNEATKVNTTEVKPAAISEKPETRKTEEEAKPVLDSIEFSDFVRGKKKFSTKFDTHNDRK